jgi:hypothetical protein
VSSPTTLNVIRSQPSTENVFPSPGYTWTAVGVSSLVSIVVILSCKLPFGTLRGEAYVDLPIDGAYPRFLGFYGSVLETTGIKSKPEQGSGGIARRKECRVVRVNTATEDRVIAEVKRLCCSTLDEAALQHGLAERLRQDVPFDAYCFYTNDLASELITRAFAENLGSETDAFYSIYTRVLRRRDRSTCR